MALIHAQASPPPQLVLQNEHPLKGKPVPSSAAVYDLCPLVAFKKAQRVDQQSEHQSKQWQLLYGYTSSQQEEQEAQLVLKSRIIAALSRVFLLPPPM